MLRRERLMATLKGEPVDRPAVNFFEIGGYAVDPSDPDEFNIYNSPSWRSLLQFTEEKTDIIRMRRPILTPSIANTRDEFFKTETFKKNGSKFTRITLDIADRTLTSLKRRDPQIDTEWGIEYLLKNQEDIKTFLELPDNVFEYDYDVSNLTTEDEKTGDKGIVMVDVDLHPLASPLLSAFVLFSMQDFLVVAMTEQKMFHQLLEKFAGPSYRLVEKVAKGFPGHLYRISGAEVCCEPYLPPQLFQEYEVRYTQPIVDIIHRYDSFARLHCHGRIKTVLPYILDMGVDAIDPVEPPPQGDMDLAELRREYGKDVVIFGNLEITDIENTDPRDFENIVKKSLRDGTCGKGRGFVLLPSASPYGRVISSRTMTNYETMVRLAANFQ